MLPDSGHLVVPLPPTGLLGLCVCCRRWRQVPLLSCFPELPRLEEAWLSCSLGNTHCLQIPVEGTGSLGTTRMNVLGIGRLLTQFCECVSGPGQASWLSEYEGTLGMFSHPRKSEHELELNETHADIMIIIILSSLVRVGPKIKSSLLKRGYTWHLYSLTP